MNNLNDSSNTSNDSSSTDLKNLKIGFGTGPIVPPAFMFKMTFPDLASILASIIYLGIEDKLNRFKKHTTKQK